MPAASDLRIDPEFKSLIPPMGPEDRQQLEAGLIGFEGYRGSGGSIEELTLMPTKMAPHFWIWSHKDLRSGVETFSKRPMALSRMPISAWRGFQLTAKPMAQVWEYPPEPEDEIAAELTNIYFIQGINGGPIKVGHARDVIARLMQFQTGSPVKLQVIRVIENAPLSVESELHKRFHAYRLHGEWFDESILKII